MYKFKCLWIALFLVATFGITSCEMEIFEHEENEKVISEHHEDESHEMGENCMRCHYSEGEGEGWFTTAGTIVKEDHGSVDFSKLEVWITTLPDGQGTVLQKIEVDDKGNFYTTEPIDYSKPRYVMLKGENDEESMDAPLYHGQCNLCHGVSEEPIEF